MTRPEIELPDDVEALKAMVLAMAAKAARVEALEKQVDDLEARNADADERIERLTQILKAFDRARFGRRSERLASSTVDDEQHAFVFEEIETGIATIKAQVTKGRGSADSKRAPRPRKGFAPHLERVEVVIEPEELPEHAGKTKILIGEDVSERLDVVAAKFRVIVTRRPKYAFRNEDGVVQAAAPAHIIEGGIPTEATSGPDRRFQICRRAATLSPGSHLRTRQGRTRPQADGSMDGQAGVRAQYPRRLHPR
ncbi:transposase [Rhizobium aethiopicum]|uniref:Transposase n=1 Tax=Rhizobium aethiopicum TaxID=1138170 RepID=A0A7W6Q970_9HYPH|nr:transposase [Rhizobium aethiopicum]MBB4583005.1 transposase [Rhizobium aethiopicum]